MRSSNRALFRFWGVAPDNVFARLPQLRGRRISVSYRPHLTAWRGELLSRSHKGDAVYAGCFLRKRRIVLDQQMVKTPRVLERIFVHEVFHFVWSRLARDLRESYELMILSEIQASTRGELGWSAESLKIKLSAQEIATRNRKWKDYLCESFCDTGGWLYGTATRYSEMTLDRASRDLRRAWIRENIETRPITI
ncbi:MAG: hypothetical protein H7039_22005 [Bryobacteraceae bacterium]|nr:hypothetical protein [Bryobacteraceae bacterium]